MINDSLFTPSKYPVITEWRYYKSRETMDEYGAYIGQFDEFGRPNGICRIIWNDG